MAGALQSPDLKTGRKEERAERRALPFTFFPAFLCAPSLPHPKPGKGLKQMGTPAPSRCLRALGVPAGGGSPAAGARAGGGFPLPSAAETPGRVAQPSRVLGGHLLAGVTPPSSRNRSQPSHGELADGGVLAGRVWVVLRVRLPSDGGNGSACSLEGSSSKGGMD